MGGQKSKVLQVNYIGLDLESTRLQASETPRNLILCKKIKGSLFLSCTLCFCRQIWCPPNLNLLGCSCGNMADKGQILPPSPMPLTPCQNSYSCHGQNSHTRFRRGQFSHPTHETIYWTRYCVRFQVEYSHHCQMS